jgi:TatD DNase family protein
MLVDTHCHINIMIKKKFDTPLEPTMFPLAQTIIDDAHKHDVTRIINVGTSLIESINCIEIAKRFEHTYATVGIHPNDCTSAWRDDMQAIKKLLENKEHNKIVGIGECGLDFHYPDFDKQRQIDAFRAQIELALDHSLALVIHSRDAADETLNVLHEYKNDLRQGVFHCFSYDASIAQEAIALGFVLGIGGTITYPKNEELRTIVRGMTLEQFILETDAPFLPPQHMRGKQNHPAEIQTIAEYIAKLREESFEKIAERTTQNSFRVFGINPTSL